MADDLGFCDAEVWRGDTWHPLRVACGKKAKSTLADGTPVCGIHARVESEAARRKAERAAWRARIEAVNEALGIAAYGWDVNGPVEVKVDELERLVGWRGDLAVSLELLTVARPFQFRDPDVEARWGERRFELLHRHGLLPCDADDCEYCTRPGSWRNRA